MRGIMQLDYFDFALLGSVLVSSGLLLKYYAFADKPSQVQGDQAGGASTDDDNDETSFVKQMQAGDKKLVFVYGSQTGTADEYATRLSKEAVKMGLPSLCVDPEDYDMDEFSELIAAIPDHLVVFLVATYGDGEPTDNAQEMHEWLSAGDDDLTGFNYMVFGLGNKQYEQYQYMSNFMDKRLKHMGGTRLYDLGEGDDGNDIEKDFVDWSKGMWPHVFAHFGKPMPDVSALASVRQFDLVVQNDFSPRSLYVGEHGALGSQTKQQGPFNAKNPLMAEMQVKRELIREGAGRSCMHIELDLEGSTVNYETGDHVGIYATNPRNEVEALCRALRVDPDQTFRMQPKERGAKPPFPNPCSFRTALSHYVDIRAVVKQHHLKELVQYASDERDKAFLARLATDAGKAEYTAFIIDDNRTFCCVLEKLASLRVDVGHMLELMPHLQPRFYSISSSATLHPKSVHVTAMLVEYTTSVGRHAKGVCTGFLEDMTVGDKCPVFIRPSHFRLPKIASRPIVMIGPGTGVAPFRAFAQERAHTKQLGKQVGASVLYFGCRTRTSDFLYEGELDALVKADALTLHVAFSREDKDKKVYVQHVMADHKPELWKLIDEGAYLYICGDGKYMAKDVHHTLVDVITEGSGRSKEDAEHYLKRLQSQGRFSLDVW